MHAIYSTLRIVLHSVTQTMLSGLQAVQWTVNSDTVKTGSAMCLIHYFFSITYHFFLAKYYCFMGRGSSVGIATRYGLDGAGIESTWGEIFHTRPDRPWGPPSLLFNGYRVFPRGKAMGAWC
jgi:hypothetical protein